MNSCVRKKLYIIFCAALFLFSFSLTEVNAEKRVVDGTHYLLEQKETLDKVLQKKYLTDSQFRASIRANRAFLRNLKPYETEKSFQVFNFSAGIYEHRSGTLVVSGEHCHIFVENEFLNFNGKESSAIFSKIAENFDSKVYPTVTNWFGKPAIPAKFELPDDKIYIFLVDIFDNFNEGYVAGYFDHRDLEGLLGNQKPVFFMDMKPGKPGEPGDKNNSFYRTLAHEFQHMVSFSIRNAAKFHSEDRWLDEGLSMLSEYLYSGEVGDSKEKFPPVPHLQRFLERPQVNLLASSKESWFSEDSLYRQYGASFLFVWYLIEKYGGETIAQKQIFTRALVNSAFYGADGIDQALKTQNESFKQAFMNWCLACYLNEPNANNGKWSLGNIKSHFGPYSDLLPLKPVSHRYSKNESSFLGSEGNVIANAMNLEEISGTGTLKLNFSGETKLSPQVLKLKKDGTYSLSQIVLDSNGKSELLADLDTIKKVAILPVAFNKDELDSNTIGYSFTADTKGLVLYPMPNPTLPEQFIIVLRSFNSSLLATPSLKISFNNLMDSPRFEPANADRNLFIAHYRIPGTGKGQALVFSGEDSCSFSFSAAIVRGGKTVMSSCREANLEVQSRNLSVAQSCVFMSDSPVSEVPGGCMALSRTFDIIFPAGFSSDSKLVIEAENGSFPGKPGMWLNHFDGGGEWIEAKNENGQFLATVKTSGSYCLVADQMPPNIVSTQFIDSEKPGMILNCSDNASGIDPESVKIKCRGSFIESTIVRSSAGEIEVSLPDKDYYREDFEVQISDMAGNTSSKMFAQSLVGEAKIFEATVFPNPCQNKVFFRLRLEGASARDPRNSGVIKIYDVSGKKVRALPMNIDATGDLSARWDCKNASGKSVSNGVYFYKARVYSGGRELKKAGKLAVLK